MGLDVEIRGRLRNLKHVEPLVELVRARCEEHKWTYRLVEEVVEDVSISHVPDGIGRARAIEGQGPLDWRDRLHRRGIMVRPHFRAGVISFVFDMQSGTLLNDDMMPIFDEETGRWIGRMFWGWSSATMAYAGGDVHCDVCDLLREVRDRFPGLRIRDSGGYLRHGDRAKMREQAAEHVLMVGALAAGLAALPGIEVQSSAGDPRVDPLQSLMARSTPPYDHLTEADRRCLVDAVRYLSHGLGYREIEGGNAERLVADLDTYLQERRDLITGSSEDARTERWNLGACFGACVVALFGGYWQRAREQNEDAPFDLHGVSVAAGRVDPSTCVMRALNHMIPERLVDQLDVIRWNAESYLTTYGPPRFEDKE